MTIKLLSLNDFGSQQPLIRGQLIDVVRGGPPYTPPMIELWRRSADSRLQAPYPTREAPLVVRQLPRARFVISGDPLTTFTLPDTGQVVRLTLRVQANGYAPHDEDIDLDRDSLTPSVVTRTIVPTSLVSGGANTRDVKLLNAPLWDNIIPMIPRQRHLAGRVVEETDPDQPIPGVSIAVMEPAIPGQTQSNSDGYFRINNLPLASAIGISVSKPGFVSRELAVPLDYRIPVNQFAFAMTPIAP